MVFFATKSIASVFSKIHCGEVQTVRNRVSWRIGRYGRRWGWVSPGTVTKTVGQPAWGARTSNLLRHAGGEGKTVRVAA